MMSGSDPTTAPTTEGDSDSSDVDSFDEGRYLYCVVDTSSSPPDEFSATGLDREAHVITGDDGRIGVVVHECDSIYASENPTQVHQWLLGHQRVVDEAGDTFGTPIPFRFHTILRGDDETVRSWIDGSTEIEDHLRRLANHWEYRISLDIDDDQLEARVTTEDEELRSLRARKEGADSGKSFLLEKQFEQQLANRKRARREELVERLRDVIAPHVDQAERLGRRQSTLESIETAGTSAARIATLTHESDVDALGEALDGIASRPEVTIEFTGPWPPYTFAPSLETSRSDGSNG